MVNPSKLMGAAMFVGNSEEFDAFWERQGLLTEARVHLVNAGYREIADQVDEARLRDYSRNIQDLISEY